MSCVRLARRLEWVLKDVHPWTLPNSVAAEDRQQAILQAVQQRTPRGDRPLPARERGAQPAERHR